MGVDGNSSSDEKRKTANTNTPKRGWLGRVPPLSLGGVAVALALIVAAAWCGRSRTPVAESAVQSTVSVRITRHDALGMPSPPALVRSPPRVRAIVEALGIDGHPATKCPPDYASAEVGLLLSGRDVYGRRNVYVWNLFGDAAAAVTAADAASAPTPTPNVIVVTSSGCRGGPPADASALRRQILEADAGGAPPTR